MFQPQIKLSVDGGGKGLKNLHSGGTFGFWGKKSYEKKEKHQPGSSPQLRAEALTHRWTINQIQTRL
ncbi:hypothetical protein TNIN_139811 [Trichonephila inaurata madagascariensis]|uniref:Uncharacterized protein n=1 Tax=Trichonephila inaurata madagascariensis TaxID=2747483 RepID=A0A8X6KGT8_9ARAC|nr:hypothetical protein TNIN_139811 [Trichonephila inaurata madagascariensis]